MSVGAMVPVLELFAINAFEELEPLLESPEGELLFLQRKEGYLRPPGPPLIERCSSFSVTGPGFTILAHNEHWLAGDLGNIAWSSIPATAVSASPRLAACPRSV